MANIKKYFQVSFETTLNFNIAFNCIISKERLSELLIFFLGLAKNMWASKDNIMIVYNWSD